MLWVVTSNFTGFIQVKIKSRFDKLDCTSKSHFYCLDQVETLHLNYQLQVTTFFIVTTFFYRNRT